MFGILFFAFCGLCGIAWELVKVYQNYVMRKNLTDEEKEKEKEQGYYHSMWGGKRDIKTGQQVVVLTDEKTGDECLHTPGTVLKKGEFIRNVSAEKRQKRIEDEIKDGTGSVYWYDLPETHLPERNSDFNNSMKDIKGTRYKDRETEHIYVVRYLDTNTKFGKRNFFMDITKGNEGKLVRLCDNEFFPNMYYPNLPYPKQDNEDDMRIIQDFIDDFNVKQSKDFSNNGDHFFLNHYYFNDHEGVCPYAEENKANKWSH